MGRLSSPALAARSTLADDALDGLTRPVKELPAKHFYDARGSELFDRITELPEYYPTRAERAILEASADEIVAVTGAAELVELGAGTAAKTRVLLDAMARAGSLRRYVPFDVDGGMVRETAAAIGDEYERVEVVGVSGDFEHDLDEIPDSEDPRIVAFLGGTIGNFTPGSRRRFLRDLAARLDDRSFLLLGADLVKDPAIIEAAYNDSQGVTAEFNLNVLRVLNRELDADFDLDQYEHVAFYDEQREWIEMRLRARRPQSVRVDAIDLDVHFGRGEELRTEISAKFTPERVRADLGAAGLELVRWLTDPEDLFALSLSRTAAATAPRA
jgi:L-histidine Nalpha-methyltransferase